MISIVLVSHSAGLAVNTAELAGQVAQGRVKILTAGGLDATTLGTNVEIILQALMDADNPDGTLVLMDLGSAVLSAETAVEMLPPEQRARVRLSAAPFVEGAVAAAVQASLGSDLETVHRQALRGLEPKVEQLGGASYHIDVVAPPSSSPSEAETLVLTLQNRVGLHARPAARLVQLVSGFDADVRVTNLSNGSGPVSARSIIDLTTLAALQGHRIAVQASGPQAAQALAVVRALVESNFGE